jgi:hypothetical protein
LDDASRMVPEDIERVKGLSLAVADDRRARLEASITKAVAEACRPVGREEPPMA